VISNLELYWTPQFYASYTERPCFTPLLLQAGYPTHQTDHFTRPSTEPNHVKLSAFPNRPRTTTPNHMQRSLKRLHSLTRAIMSGSASGNNPGSSTDTSATSSKKKLNVHSFPRPPLCERTDRHLLIKWNDVVVADTNEAYWVLETTHPPSMSIQLDQH